MFFKILYAIFIVLIGFIFVYGFAYETARKSIMKEVLSNCDTTMTVEICDLEIQKSIVLKKYIELDNKQKKLKTQN